MKTKTKKFKQGFAIFAFSEMQDDYAPTLWPKFTSINEAKTFAKGAIVNGTKYEVRPVRV